MPRGDRPPPLTRAFPISIDAGEFAEAARRARSSSTVRGLRDSLGPSALAIGVDRLDYSKGLVEKFQAFGEFLHRHPDSAGRLTLLQVAPVSRGGVPSYRELRHELERIAGHLNGQYSNPQWTPIRYVNRNLGRQALAGFYSAAHLALVTPLRDGMNLVAKEFVAAQDLADPGVLLLSRFAGAAEQLSGALLVNPYDIGGVADAIGTAVRMDAEERRERHAQSLRSLQEEDIHWWTASFLQALATRTARGTGAATATRGLTAADEENGDG